MCIRDSIKTGQLRKICSNRLIRHYILTSASVEVTEISILYNFINMIYILTAVASLFLPFIGFHGPLAFLHPERFTLPGRDSMILNHIPS